MNIKKINKKVPASSLLFTIYVSLVLYLVTGAFVLLYFLYSNFLNQTVITGELKTRCKSGIAYYMANSEKLTPGIPFRYTLPDGNKVVLKKKLWGLFELLNIESRQGKYSVKGSFLVGASKHNINALYIADKNKHIKASGNTRITGLITVPGGHIQQSYFAGSISPVGKIRESRSSLPPLVLNIAPLLPTTKNNMVKTENKTIHYADFKEKEFIVPFSDTTLVLHSQLPINLTDISLKGKIVIRSEKKIDVYSSAQLTDVIVSAPEITVHSNFKGSVQLFSDSVITIGNNCSLDYPSVVTVTATNEGQIQVNSGSTVAGAVILDTKSPINGSKIIIEQNSIVYGIVYCSELCRIGGDVFGGISTKYIGSPENISEINIISNVTINSLKLREEFVLPITFRNQPRSVVDGNYFVNQKKTSD